MTPSGQRINGAVDTRVTHYCFGKRMPDSADRICRTDVRRLTLSGLVGDQQEVAVEAQQHGQAGVELPQGGALDEGLEGGGHRGQGETVHVLACEGRKQTSQGSIHCFC